MHRRRAGRIPCSSLLPVASFAMPFAASAGTVYVWPRSPDSTDTFPASFLLRAPSKRTTRSQWVENGRCNRYKRVSRVRKGTSYPVQRHILLSTTPENQRMDAHRASPLRDGRCNELVSEIRSNCNKPFIFHHLLKLTISVIT
jgi:hypothetical protein